ncbi:hypothetical protein JSY36_06530 [Bacillus sp. H-16]|uniref:hypothetical protein n=1 Tax=Alteribacter salitolerans TaxID=2912333 RepID=UPI00196610EB|nr:hypothetical protein [Alteribacter salitolerans]MBM7095402.1 hypothetical protein [Alteribacter salitolerans]
MKKIISGLTAGALAMSLFIGSAFAGGTIDYSNGQGFVGKGDVQSALGYNNSQLQQNADKLEFTYQSVDTYEITVEWTTGEGTRGEKTHTVEHKRTSTFSSDVDYDTRKAKQVTGFYLEGFANETTEGNIPEVGDEFPGNSGHKVKSVELVSSTGTLFVNGVEIQ